DDDGYWVIRGRLPPDTGALVTQVLEQAIDEQFQELKDVPAGIFEAEEQTLRSKPEPIAWRRADALVRMARGYRSNKASGKASGTSDKFLVHIHTNLETLKANGAGAESELEPGGRICAEASRRICCDSATVQWLDADGHSCD